ncbi:hypothetical protein [Burkholderia sp. 22PA0106]|uniref:hypothetical protein n=1 Tax=Burkholderia sp. 22PA0106 TaxID=3237371 RepID=UPI0039C0BA7A
MNDELVRHVADRIARYLEACPAAADTIEGVHRFWIDAHDAQESIDVTLAALESLRARGVVARVAIGNRTLWRVRREGDHPPEDDAGR